MYNARAKYRTWNSSNSLTGCVDGVYSVCVVCGLAAHVVLNLRPRETDRSAHLATIE